MLVIADVLFFDTIIFWWRAGKIEKVSPCPSTEDAMSPVALAPPEVAQSTRFSDGVEQKHATGGVVNGSRNFNYQGRSPWGLTWPLELMWQDDIDL